MGLQSECIGLQCSYEAGIYGCSLDAYGLYDIRWLQGSCSCPLTFSPLTPAADDAGGWRTSTPAASVGMRLWHSDHVNGVDSFVATGDLGSLRMLRLL